MPHPAIGGTRTKQLLCSAHGVCGAPTSLDPWLNWRGGPPLGAPGPFSVSAGPGLGVQLTAGPHTGRIIFSGHAGQVDVTWFSDDSGRSWSMSSSLFGSNNKSSGFRGKGQWGCYRAKGCYDEPFAVQLPDAAGTVQLNMRNDSLTCGKAVMLSRFVHDPSR